MKIKEAREQLLSQIGLQMHCNYEAGSEASTKLQEFYEYVQELPTTNLIFQW